MPMNAAVLSSFALLGLILRKAGATIYRHDFVDGQVQETSCASLEQCLREGISSPGMLLHRSWALEVEEAMRKRKQHLEGLNRSALLARQAQVRRALRSVLRAELPRGPPRARLVREFRDEARGVDVQLMLLETRPGHAAPAALFLPLAGRRGPGAEGQRLPAVLHIPGHLAAGFRHPEEQQISLGLAQRGYIVLSFDPLSQGERRQYRQEDELECTIACQEDGGFRTIGPPCTAAHNHFGKQLWLAGASAAEVFLQDAQRVLDFLAAFPLVDATRIGVTGCSGGGMLTAYLGAVDARVAASVVACYFSTMERELGEGTCNYDAEQILWKQAKLGLDKPDFLVSRAPLTTLVLLTSHDCFPLMGGREGFDEAAEAFAVHGMVNGELSLYASESAGYHGVTETGLRAVHMLLHERLGAEGTSAELPAGLLDSPLPCRSLWLGARAGHAGRPSPVVRLVRQLAGPLLQRLRVRRRLARRAPAAAGRWLGSLPSTSARVAGLDLPPVGAPSAAAAAAAPRPVIARAQFYRNGIEEWYLLQTRRLCAVTLRLFRFTGTEADHAKSNTSDPRRSAGYGMSSRRLDAPVAIHFGGEAVINRELDSLETGLLGELHARGISLVIAGLCGFGDELWRGGMWEFAPLLLGRTHAGLHADEVLRTVSWAVEVLGAPSVILIAVEDSAPAVLHAALHMRELWPQRNVSLTRQRPGSGEAAAVGARSEILAGLALVRSIGSFADVVGARRHHMPWQMQMYGVLEHYDLPDLLAALAVRGGPRALVLAPLDAERKPLSWRRALDLYELALNRFAAAGCRLQIRPGPWRAEVHAVGEFVAAAGGVQARS